MPHSTRRFRGNALCAGSQAASAETPHRPLLPLIGHVEAGAIRAGELSNCCQRFRGSVHAIAETSPRGRAHMSRSVARWLLKRWRPPRSPATAETVQVGCRIHAELDPVPAGPVAPDGRIGTEAVHDPQPPRPCDAQVDHARRFQVSNFPAGCPQSRLIAITRAPFDGRAYREHGDDESLPQHVTQVTAHQAQDKRTPSDQIHGSLLCREEGDAHRSSACARRPSLIRSPELNHGYRLSSKIISCSR